MARTRGASQTGIQDRDGVMLGRSGNPISPYATRGKLSQADVIVAAEQPPPEPEPPVTRYMCNDATLMRDLDAWELAKLLNIAMGGGLEISMAPDEFAGINPNLRRHFRPVRGVREEAGRVRARQAEAPVPAGDGASEEE